MTNEDDGRLLLKPSEVAVQLSFTERYIRELMARGQIKTVHFGRAVRIPVSEVVRLARDGVERE